MTSKVRAPKHNHRSPCYGYNGPIQFHWVDVVRSGVGHKDVAKKLRNISPRVVRLFEVGDLPRVGTRWHFNPKSGNKKLTDKGASNPAGAIKTDQSSCPHSCGFHPSQWLNEGEKWHMPETPVDWQAMQEIDEACKDHHAFGYTHTRGDDATKAHKLKHAVINVSCDTSEELSEYFRKGFDTVIAVSTDKKKGDKLDKVTSIDGVPVVMCPAQTVTDKNVTCAGEHSCGGKRSNKFQGRPLCARSDRGYAIGFYIHGNRKKIASNEMQDLVQIGG